MERLHEIKKEAYAENLSCLSHWEPIKLPRPPQLWARWSNPFVLDLIRILQEIDDHGIIVKIVIYFNQNSFSQPYYPTIQMTLEFFGELYDHRIIVKFVLDLIRILREIDDHWIIVKIFIYFDQNSLSQPYYQTIQMTLEFFKNCMTTEFSWNLSWIWLEFFKK